MKARTRKRSHNPPPHSILVTHAVAAGITGTTTVLPGPAEQTLPPGVSARRGLHPLPRSLEHMRPTLKRRSPGRRTSEPG